MSLLASFYCGETVRPILLDFSKLPPSQSSVARASEMSYTQLYKSLNRFYAWAYASELDGFDKDSLLKMDPPVYEENKQETKASREEINAIWNLAKERVQGCSDDAQIKMIFGEAMYDILALEATSHPIAYLRALGTASGVLYPPDRLHPNKRFVFSQDMLETIMRCCVLPDEVLSSDELRNRLWDRFGIVIGGRTFEMGILQKSGMIIQVDEDSLEDNFSAFANELEAMDFAEMMADGILQIRMGGKQV